MGWSEFDEAEEQAIQARVDAEVAAAVLAEREACVKTCEACEDTGDSTGIEREVTTWNKAVAYCVRRLKERSNA